MLPAWLDTLALAREPAGLYIHVPFCARKCPYCDFYSVADLALKGAYLSALGGEMRRLAGLALQFDTVYIGGGTPSLLKPQEIEEILAEAHRCFRILPGAEITLEVNPGTVAAGSLSQYRKGGINRLNIGVQSFDDRMLGFLGRIHSAGAAADSVRRARRAGYDRIGLDLIYGIPGQTESAWLADLARAAAFAPEHLSCYMLSYEKGTALSCRLQQGLFDPLPEETVAAFFLKTIDWLAANGYAQYEISNFTRAGAGGAPLFPSRHNRKYWSFAPYLGLGPAAHSFLEPFRFWNPKSIRRYAERIGAGGLAVAGKEKLTRQQRMIEAIFLGLRTTEGIRSDLFAKKFGLDFSSRFGSVAGELRQEGLVQIESDRCRLTRRGMLLLDSIADRLVAALPEEEE